MILDAIAFAQPSLKKEVLIKIINYRLTYIENSNLFTTSELNEFRINLQNFQNGKIDFHTIRDEIYDKFPDDRINDVLKVFK